MHPISWRRIGGHPSSSHTQAIRHAQAPSHSPHLLTRFAALNLTQALVVVVATGFHVHHRVNHWSASEQSPKCRPTCRRRKRGSRLSSPSGTSSHTAALPAACGVGSIKKEAEWSLERVSIRVSIHRRYSSVTFLLLPGARCCIFNKVAAPYTFTRTQCRTYSATVMSEKYASAERASRVSSSTLTMISCVHFPNGFAFAERIKHGASSINTPCHFQSPIRASCHRYRCFLSFSSSSLHSQGRLRWGSQTLQIELGEKALCSRAKVRPRARENPRRRRWWADSCRLRAFGCLAKDVRTKVMTCD